jgi:hypothetical protein
VIRIRPMTVLDLPLGLRLSRQAGWNQTGANWRHLLDLQPDGCFLAEWDGTPVATTTTFRLCGEQRGGRASRLGGWAAVRLPDLAAGGPGQSPAAPASLPTSTRSPLTGCSAPGA